MPRCFGARRATTWDLASFSRKFAGDMRGTQAGHALFRHLCAGNVSADLAGSGAGWSDAGVMIPWTSWLQTGDTSMIDQNWAAMEKYLDAIEAANPDGLWKNESGIAFGDWLSPEGQDRLCRSLLRPTGPTTRR